MLAIEPRKLMRGVWLTGAHLRECSRRDPARLASSAGSSSSLPCLRFIHVHVAGCPSSSEVSLFSSSLSSPSESVERSSVEQYSSPLSLSSPLTESGGLRYVRCPMYLGSSLSTGLLRPDRVVARCVLGGNGRGSFVNRTRSGVPSFLSVVATYEGSEAPLALAEGCFGHGGAGGGITHRRDDRERDGKIYRRESQVHARTRCVCWGGAIVEKSGALVDPSEIRLDTRRRHRCFELALSSGA